MPVTLKPSSITTSVESFDEIVLMSSVSAEILPATVMPFSTTTSLDP